MKKEKVHLKKKKKKRNTAKSRKFRFRNLKNAFISGLV
jgi:hypothetical protein